MARITIEEVPTPAYIVDENKLIANLKILRDVKKKADCKILLAQKAFSMFAVYPLIAEYLDGTTASGLYEARLSHEEMGKENHVYAPAFKASDIEELGRICEHVTFNSFTQLNRYAGRVAELHRQYFPDVFSSAATDHDQNYAENPARHIESHENQFDLSEKSDGFEIGKNGTISDKYSDARRYFRKYGDTGIGLRLNPECSTQGDHAIYDPCAPGSRLGITEKNFRKGMEEYPEAFALVDGLHVHTLCEQNADDLATTLKAVEEKFGDILKSSQIRWLNLGGGHHITRADYDRELLVTLVKHMKESYDVEVYLEPGEAIALNAGCLVTEVLDIVDNGLKTLVLDASAACHMPDVLEMPYRPPLRDSGKPGERPYTYRLSSLTCLAGDTIGDYSFDHEIKVGDRLVFEDMAIYSMVKNNTFNGIPLPSIYLMREDGNCELVKAFGYQDFKNRLS